MSLQPLRPVTVKCLIARWMATQTTQSSVGETATRSQEPLGGSYKEEGVKTGILMMNMGGPEKAEHVHDFLFRLFSDRDLMKLPMQNFLAPRIAKRRTPKIIEQYAAIGGGSPILSWTKKQGDGMVERLSGTCPEFGPYKYYVGFSYAAPLLEDTLRQMEADGVERAVAFSQYPQYSCSTTGACLNALARHYLAARTPLSSIRRWSVIDRWPAHPGLVEAFTERIRDALQEFPAGARNDVVILFSAHSLPMFVVNRGDPYPYEVAATVSRVMESLGQSHPWRLVWQSKVGFMPWLAPSTEHAIKLLVKQGRKDMLIVPIAFVNDHIETLYELDIEYIGATAKEAGARHVVRAKSLNDAPAFLQCLAEVVKNHLLGDAVATPQLFLRCPGCSNTSCKQMRASSRASATRSASCVLQAPAAKAAFCRTWVARELEGHL